MAVDIDQTICDSMEGPKEGAEDGLSFKRHPLPDLIKAARYLEGKGAIEDVSARRRMNLAKFVAPGSI